MSVGHLPVFFGKTSIQVLCPFLNQVVFSMLDCMSSLYILDINPLSDISRVNIFFHSVSGLVVLLIISFAVQMFFSLVKTIYVFLFLFPLPEETYPKNYC